MGISSQSQRATILQREQEACNWKMAAAEVPVPRAHSGAIEQRPSEAKKNAPVMPLAKREIQAVLGRSAHMGGMVACQLAFL